MKRSASLLYVLGALALLQCRPPQGGAGTGDHGPGTPARGATTNKQYEATAPHAERQKPPPEGITPEWSFPNIAHAKLGNGMELRVVERHHLPLVELRLVLRSGQASDGAKPGVALMAGEMLKVGGTGQLSSRQLLDRVESLGASLSVITARDSTTVTLAVTREHLQTALGILSDVVQKPAFAPAEYSKLKRREMDRTQSLAHSDPGWAASMVLYRELFELPTGSHPYATYDATSKQIERVMLPDCRAWYAKHVTPANAVLVVAGDVNTAEVQGLAQSAFGKWSGKAPPDETFFRPLQPSGVELYLVDRPGSTQAEIFVATLGPERQSDDWVPLKVGNQVLGGGVAGRLFLDVREQRSLAYRSYSVVESVAHGPAPVVLRAGTQTAKAGLALKALLEHVARMGNTAPSAEEVNIATRYLSDIFLLRVETVGAIADMTADLAVLGLDDDYYDDYRRAVSQVTSDSVQRSAAKFFDPGRVLVVVSGDAQVLQQPLSFFATVNVVDPANGFATSRSVPQDPKAPIELERKD